MVWPIHTLLRIRYKSAQRVKLRIWGCSSLALFFFFFLDYSLTGPLLVLTAKKMAVFFKGVLASPSLCHSSSDSGSSPACFPPVSCSMAQESARDLGRVHTHNFEFPFFGFSFAGFPHSPAAPDSNKEGRKNLCFCLLLPISIYPAEIVSPGNGSQLQVPYSFRIPRTRLTEV